MAAAAGAWDLYDESGYYLPAFAVGIGFNIVNLVILLARGFRQRSDGVTAAGLTQPDSP